MNNPLLETKVTRTELLDIILDDMVEELNRQLTELEKVEEKLGEPKLSLADAIKLASNDAEVDVTEGYRDEKKTYIKISFHIKTSQLPDAYKKHSQDKKALEERQSELRVSRNKLTEGKQRARSELIRRSLEASADGQELLKMAAGMKLRISKKLLGDGK